MGKQNRHDSPQAGEIVVYELAALQAAAADGSIPARRRVTVGWQPRSIASLVRPDLERVFVVNYHQTSYSVTVLDRRTWAQVNETSIGQGPIDVAVHPGRGRAYVTDGYHGIRVLDAVTGAELTVEKIETDREVPGLAIDPATDTLYAARSKQYGGPPVDELVVINLATGAITRRVTLPAGSNPQDVAYDPATGRLYIGCIGPVGPDGKRGVLVLDKANLAAPPTRLLTTAGVLGVALRHAAGSTYVYAAAGGSLQVLDAVRGERVGSVAVARQLGSVAVDQATGDIYAGDNYDGRLFRVAGVVADNPVGRHRLVLDGSLGPALGGVRPAPDGEALLQPFHHGTAVASADFGAVAVRPGHAAAWLSRRPRAAPGTDREGEPRCIARQPGGRHHGHLRCHDDLLRGRGDRHQHGRRSNPRPGGLRTHLAALPRRR